MQVTSSQTGDMQKEEEEEEGYLCSLQIFFSIEYLAIFPFIKRNLIFNSPRYVPSIIRHYHSNDQKVFCRLLVENTACSNYNF